MLDNVSVEFDLRQSKSQNLKVRIIYKPKKLTQELCLPSWTPGSYKVRDHSQFIYDIKAKQNNQNITDENIKLIDEKVISKEKEIMTI